MDWDTINNIWIEFCSRHGLELKNTDQHLIINKRQTYSTVESINSYIIYYKYVFFKLDTIDVGNEFRIAIPIETAVSISISRPNLIIRTIQNKKINYSTDLIKLDSNTENKIIRLFNNFSDLKISITKIQINSDDQFKNNTTILELTTKQLPQEIEQIEELRILNINILKELIAKKVIKVSKYNQTKTICL